MGASENHLPELARLEGLLAVESVGALQRQLEIIIGQLGFDHFSCGVMRQDAATRMPSVHLLSCYPQDWQAHYAAHHYFEQDPVIAHTIRHRKPLPVIWSEPGTLADPVHDRIFSEAFDFGLRSGVTVSCQGVDQVGVLSLSSDRNLAAIRGELPRALGSAQLLACYLQEVWNRLGGQIAPHRAFSLSQRELECLHWAAAGKTSWEIARILSIAERTVVFHIGRAVEKLQVSNRRQAVAKAITSGLITP